MFLYHHGQIHIFLLVYVDDIILTSNHEDTMNWITNQLQAKFAIKDLRSFGYFLGIQATQDATGLHLRQTKYVLDILNRTHMTNSKPYKAPCVVGSKMSKCDGELLSNLTSIGT